MTTYKQINFKGITLIQKVKLVEDLIERIEKEGVSKLSEYEFKEYNDLKNWFAKTTKKLRYI